METVWNNFGKEPRPSDHESNQESFELHTQRMKIFQKDHGPAEPNKHLKAPSTPYVKKEPAASEYQKILVTLLSIGYILRLVQERGTALLPRNWQN
jgi:hypothetical protein